MNAASTGLRVRLSVEALEVRCLLSTASYVNALYTDLLHRPGSVADVAGWVEQIDAGVPPVQVASAFTSSAEYLGNLVANDYQALLQRQPQPGEVQGWMNQLQNGLTEQQLAAVFEGSPEYFALHGNDNGNWVNALYQAALGRAPAAGDTSYWVGQLQNGISRQAVARQIDTSLEAAELRVTTEYQQLLGHAPDAGGLAYWAGQLQQGVTPAQFAARLAGSQEFINLQGGLGNAPVPTPGSPSTQTPPDNSPANPYDTGSNSGFIDTGDNGGITPVIDTTPTGSPDTGVIPPTDTTVCDTPTTTEDSSSTTTDCGTTCDPTNGFASDPGDCTDPGLIF